MGQESGVVWFLRTGQQIVDRVVVVAVEGRVSNATAEELARALEPHDISGFRGLVVDLSGVDYINGAGLRVFGAAAQRLARLECPLVVCGLHPVVKTAFDLAGPDPDLLIEESRETALRRLTAEGGRQRADT